MFCLVFPNKSLQLDAEVLINVTEYQAINKNNFKSSII